MLHMLSIRSVVKGTASACLSEKAVHRSLKTRASRLMKWTRWPTQRSIWHWTRLRFWRVRWSGCGNRSTCWSQLASRRTPFTKAGFKKLIGKRKGRENGEKKRVHNRFRELIPYPMLIGYFNCIECIFFSLKNVGLLTLKWILQFVRGCKRFIHPIDGIWFTKYSMYKIFNYTPSHKWRVQKHHTKSVAVVILAHFLFISYLGKNVFGSWKLTISTLTW